MTLNGAAPSTGQVVNLASNNSAVVVPASVTVPAGYTAATFSASISAVSTSQTGTITATSGGASQSVVLQLNPVGSPQLTTNASSIAFGTTTLNSTSTQTVTLSSTGSSAVTISGVSVSGAGFSISGIATPLTLNPGQTAILNVMFSPTVAGTVSGNVSITSNSSTGSSTSIGLSGTGQSIAHEVDLSWLAPSNSPVPVAGYLVFRASSGTSSYQQLNSSAVTLTSFVDSNVTSGQAYDYMVESVDSSGNTSVPSNIASAVIP